MTLMLDYCTKCMIHIFSSVSQRTNAVEYFMHRCVSNFVCSYGFVTFESQDDAEKVMKRTVSMIPIVCSLLQFVMCAVQIYYCDDFLFVNFAWFCGIT